MTHPMTVICSPETGAIYAGQVNKAGTGMLKGHGEVTTQAIVATVNHALLHQKSGKPVEVYNKIGPSYRIEVTEIETPEGIFDEEESNDGE